MLLHSFSTGEQAVRDRAREGEDRERGKGRSPVQPTTPTLGGCHLQVPKSCFFAPSYPVLPHERKFCLFF